MRKLVGAVFVAGFLTDQFGYAGEYGGKVLRSLDFSTPAAPYYEGLGTVMNFAWVSAKELATGINNIVQEHNNP